MVLPQGLLLPLAADVPLAPPAVRVGEGETLAEAQALALASAGVSVGAEDSVGAAVADFPGEPEVRADALALTLLLLVAEVDTERVRGGVAVTPLGVSEGLPGVPVEQAEALRVLWEEGECVLLAELQGVAEGEALWVEEAELRRGEPDVVPLALPPGERVAALERLPVGVTVRVRGGVGVTLGEGVEV